MEQGQCSIRHKQSNQIIDLSSEGHEFSQMEMKKVKKKWDLR